MKIVTVVTVGFCLALAGCAAKPKVEITRKEPSVQTTSRSEPIYYNGKTYQLDYSYNSGQRLFDMKVSGLGPAQRQDAINIATSGLSYYSCPDSRRAKLQGSPSFKDGFWNIKAMCG